VARSSSTTKVADHEEREKGGKTTQEKMGNMEEVNVSRYEDYERIGKERSQG
jgi:hypothetical protein